MYKSERDILVKKLVKEEYIKSEKVKEAFLNVHRHKFLPENLKHVAYCDCPLEIGLGQTISAPHMVAIMCEALDIQKGQKILEIGAGSGYHAAVVSFIVGDKGHVYSIERLEKLATKASDNLKNAGFENTAVELGDGSEGLKKYQHFDRIYVTCAAPSVPQPLINQLKDGGKLLIPVGKMYCELKLIIKQGEKLSSQNLGGSVFVPLVGKHGF